MHSRKPGLKMKVIAVGKIGRGPEKELVDEYIKRLPRATEIHEIDIKKPASKPELRKRQEAEKILGAVPKDSILVVLDEKGKAATSRQLAHRIDNWASHGHSIITFVVGGGEGIHESVYSKANFVLSFGGLTWPHKLARAMLIEQLYRAWTISTNHPYHRD